MQSGFPQLGAGRTITHEFFAVEESRDNTVRPELKWGLYPQFRAERSEFLP